MIRLNAYLNFPGNTREALTWYHSIFGGELQFNTFGEIGAVPADHEYAEKIMHGSIRGPVSIFAADNLEGLSPVQLKEGNSISLAIMGDEEERIRRWFDTLAEGGTVTAELEKQVWGDLYGEVTDRFGINWMVDVGAEGTAE
ncbi:MAG TPA: VOC family protein [Actinomycetaceae bacterium]|nr:VOC family protein [Actinomycetaceae bacterium]